MHAHTHIDCKAEKADVIEMSSTHAAEERLAAFLVSGSHSRSYGILSRVSHVSYLFFFLLTR